MTNGALGTVSGSGSAFTVPVVPTSDGAVTLQVKGERDHGRGRERQRAVDRRVGHLHQHCHHRSRDAERDRDQCRRSAFTIAFSQAVTGLDLSGLTVTNGTLSALSGSGQTFTVTATAIADGPVTLQVNANATTNGNAVHNVASNVASALFDDVAPTVAITPTGTSTSTSPITFTITFSEPVGIADVTSIVQVGNGAVVSSAGGPTVFTVDVVPDGTGAVTARIGVDETSDAAGNINDASNVASVLFDAGAHLPPTVVVTPFQPLQKAGPVSFSVVFSSDVTGFDAADLTVGNGTAPSVSGSGHSYTVQVGTVADGPVSLAVVAGAAVDAFDVPTSPSNVASTILDTTPPRVHLALTGPVPVATGITLDVTFSEPVTGFGEPLIAVSNATTSGFTSVDAATYRVVLTPSGVGASMVATVSANACSDLAGNLDLGATLTIPVESGVLSTSVTTPPVPVSSGDKVVYTALGPGTSAGLEQVRAFLAGKTNSQARGFIWDAGAQAYVQVPTAGWQPFDGVFLATREAATFDFNGNTTTLDFTLTLRPGYNFVCVPPLDDGGVVLVDHAFADLALEDTDGAVIAGTTRDALIGTGAFAWDGTAYSQVDTLHTGTGYWIENASSPPVDLVLRRVSQQVQAAVATLPAARAIGARPRSAPPPPPGGAGGGGNAGSGGGRACGVGSGLASLVLAFTALFLRLRLRSPRRD